MLFGCHPAALIVASQGSQGSSRTVSDLCAVIRRTLSCKCLAENGKEAMEIFDQVAKSEGKDAKLMEQLINQNYALLSDIQSLDV